MPIYDYKCKKCKAEFTVNHPSFCKINRCGDLSEFMSRKDPYSHLSEVQKSEFYDKLMNEVVQEKGYEKFCGLEGEVVRVYDGTTSTLDIDKNDSNAPDDNSEQDRDMSEEAVEARVKKSIRDAKEHKEKQIKDLMSDLEGELVSNLKGKK
jgi:hypothetical protein